MLALKLNTKRMAALLVAVALLVPMWPAARAETTIDPPAQGEPGVPSTPEDPSVPSTPEGGDELENTTPDNEVTTTPDTPETPPLAVPLDSRVDTPNDTLLVTQATPDQAPNIHLESNLVLDALGNPNGFVELAVKVTTSPGETMRSLSLSVQYSDLLTPVDWTTGGDVTLGLGNFSTHIPAKHSDRVTGAAAYGGGTDRYLYIEAESIEPAALTNGIVAVVRFRYDVSTTPLLYKNNQIVKVTNVGAGYDPGDPTTATTTPVGDLFPLVPDAIAATEPRAMQAVWYESADNSFYYVNGYDGTAGKQDTVTIPVNGVDTPFQKPKTAGNSVLAVRADKDPTTGTPADYYSYLSNLIPSRNITTTQVSQPSYDQSGGGITLDDVRAVVALSWSDGFIGSAVVANGAKPADIGNQVDNLTASLFENYDNTKHPSLEKGTAVDINTMYDASTNSAQYPLTCHKGYNFAGWIIVNAATSSDEWTSYDTSEKAACLAKLATPKQISDAAKNGVVYLKAAYVGNVELNKYTTIGAGESDFYTISNYVYSVVDPNMVTETTGDYSIKFTVDRLNEDGYGSTRQKRPAVRLLFTIGTTQLYMKVDVEDKDTTQVEVIAPKNADKFGYVIIDQSGIGSYTQLGRKTRDLTMYKDKPSEAGNGFLVEGTIGTFYEYSKSQYESLALPTPAISANWNTGVTMQMLKDLGISNAMDNMSSSQATTDNNKRAIAKNLISIYMIGKSAYELTPKQLDAAIRMSVGTKVNTLTTIAALRTHITNVNNAKAVNLAQTGSDVLTTAQITYAIVNAGWASAADALAAYPDDVDA